MRVPEKIRQYLDSQLRDMIRLLEQLVLLESPSLDPSSQKNILNHLQKEFEKTNYQVTRVSGRESGGMLLARPQVRVRSQPLQLLVGHTDTVWPIGTLVKIPYKENGNQLSGPGIFDMKAGLVQMIFALRTLNFLDLTPSVTPVVFLNSDEEIGSNDSELWLRRLASRSNRVFVLEPANGEEGRLKTVRSGVGLFKIFLKGRAAHAGIEPEAGASAIVELSHVIQKLESLNSPHMGISVNVGLVKGGLRPNVVAQESDASVDVRVLRRQDIATIQKAIYDLRPNNPAVKIDIQGTVSRPPLEKTPRNKYLWESALIAAKSLGFDLNESTAGGASDGNTTSSYSATLDGLGGVGGGAHSEHEFVFANRLPERAALLALLLLQPPLDQTILEQGEATNNPP